MNIETDYVYEIAMWRAIDSDTYDGAPDAGEQKTGWAKSEEFAIAELMGSMGATCEEVAVELAGRGFTDGQIAKVMNEGVTA